MQCALREKSLLVSSAWALSIMYLDDKQMQYYS